MAKMLFIDCERCTGCRLCELVCSVWHTGVANPTRARIHVVKWEDVGFYLPITCRQCEDSPCMAVCPKEALYRDPELDRVMVDYDLCIGCRSCVAACPFGAMGFDVVERKVVKCDLCDGDPLCVRFCDMKAIDFVDAETINYEPMRDASERFYNLVTHGKGVESSG